MGPAKADVPSTPKLIGLVAIGEAASDPVDAGTALYRAGFEKPEQCFRGFPEHFRISSKRETAPSPCFTAIADAKPELL